MQQKIAFFSFYGVGVTVASSNSDVLADAIHDFSYFLAPELPHIDFRINYYQEAFDYTKLPLAYSTLATPRNITFIHEKTRYIDYFGKAMNIVNAAQSSCDIYCHDVDIAREIIYLSILSNVSSLLEKRHFHRIHALGLAYKNNGVLIILPSGGGKSTLALNLLSNADPRISLISEDSPLLNHSGTLLPFPLRIGINPDAPIPPVDPSLTRYTKRMGFSPKRTIDIQQFRDKICTDAVKPRAVLLGIRSTGNAASIMPTNKFSSIKHCLMNSVIGVGLYQGMEFLMRERLSSLLKQSGTLLSRMSANIHLLARARFYHFIVGRDTQENYRALTVFLRNHFGE